jgi:hypothetical protein
VSYHPIHDVWFLARAKLKGGKKYYGAYMGGFPERARVAIGAPLNEPVLHVCGGMARDYPYARGFGEFDRTMDLDPDCKPDIVKDCRDPDWPDGIWRENLGDVFDSREATRPWAGILIDPPYSLEDADKYKPGRDLYPKPNQLVKTAINTVRVGRKVGIIHYVVPQCPKNAQFVFFAATVCGFNNRVRGFSVFERVS